MSADFNNLLITQFAPYANPLPEDTSIRKLFKLTDEGSRSGEAYKFPLKASNSHGVVRTSSTDVVSTPSAISPTTVLASVTSPDMFAVEKVAYADVMRSMSAVSQQGGDAAAYFKAIQWKIDNLMSGHELHLDIDYMHGAGSGAAIADDLGVVATTAVLAGTGPNWNSATHPKVQFTSASWCEGAWANFTNALFDVYAADGSTIRVTNVICEGVTDATKCQVQFTTTASSVVTTAAVTTGDRIVFAGAKGNSMYGVGAILQNAGTLFNVSAATNNFWRARSFAVGGALTAAKFLQACTRLHAAGCREGVEARLPALAFQDLVAERDALLRISDNIRDVEIGYEEIRFTTAAGPARLVKDLYQKQGQAYLVSAEHAVSVGSTEGPVLVGADGKASILNPLSGQTGYEVRSMSSCAPLSRIPSHNLILTGIASTGAATSGS